MSKSRRYPLLTEKELRIVELIIKGVTNRQIAQHLSISERTVKNHVTRILQKLGLKSRYQLYQLIDKKIFFDKIR